MAMVMSNAAKATERTIPAGEFKAKCLKLLDEVATTGVSLVITKRGKVCARVEPSAGTIPLPFAGRTSGAQVHGDLLEPAFPDWEAPDFPR